MPTIQQDTAIKTKFVLIFTQNLYKNITFRNLIKKMEANKKRIHKKNISYEIMLPSKIRIKNKNVDVQCL